MENNPNGTRLKQMHVYIYFEALDLLVNGIKSRSDQPGYKKDL